MTSLVPMTAESLKVLLVEDSEEDAQLIEMALRGTGLEFGHVQKLSDGLRLLAAERHDVVLLDLNLPDSAGSSTFERLAQEHPRTAILVLTGVDDEELGLQTVRAGAQDYLVKGQAERPLLVRAIRYAAHRKRAEELAARYARQLLQRNRELQGDLMLAKEVQQAFLPKEYPSFPSSAGDAVSFCHRYLPASEVGGDFFAVLKLAEERVGLVICDVMGHGVRAALITAMLRVLINVRTPGARDPGRLLAHLNRSLRPSLSGSEPPLFVSAWAAVLDVGTGELSYSSAGHPPPARLLAGTGKVELLNEGRGPVLGLMEDAIYAAQTVGLARGDRLLLYTDGAYEVRGEDERPFGLERLLALLESHATLPQKELLDAVHSELLAFCQRPRLDDDACLLAVDYVGLSP